MFLQSPDVPKVQPVQLPVALGLGLAEQSIWPPLTLHPPVDLASQWNWLVFIFSQEHGPLPRSQLAQSDPQSVQSEPGHDPGVSLAEHVPSGFMQSPDVPKVQLVQDPELGPEGELLLLTVAYHTFHSASESIPLPSVSAPAH